MSRIDIFILNQTTMKLINVFLLIFLSASLNAFELSEEQKKKLDQLVQSQVSNHSPGLAIGIVNGEQIIYKHHAGYANLNDNTPISSKTKFNYASTAKQITAYMLLELLLKKGISLEQDFRQYLADYYPAIKDRISIKHLISHSSGIRDYPALLHLQGKTWWKQIGLNNKTVLKLIKKQQTLNFNPGTEYAYSNSNYTLLTELISQISGVGFQKYSSDFFDRLGMKDTYFNRGYMSIVKNKALPYSSWESEIWKQYPMLSNLKGDGFLYTSLDDQLKWEIHLQRNADDEINRLLQQPLYSDEVNSYGFGLEFSDFHGHPSIQHSGSTGSYNSHLFRLPNMSVSIVVMSNNGSVSSRDLAIASAKILLEVKENEKDQTEHAVLNFNGENKYSKNNLVGSYFLNGDTVIKITLREGDLFREIDQREPVRLMPKGNDVYQYETMDFLHMAFKKENNQFIFKLHQKGMVPRLALKFEPEQISNGYKKSINGQYYNGELDVYLSINYLTDDKFELSSGNQLFNAAMQKKGFLSFDRYQIRIEQASDEVVNKVYLSFDNTSDILFNKTND